jgi:hypothetical protein
MPQNRSKLMSEKNQNTCNPEQKKNQIIEIQVQFQKQKI